MFTRADVLIVFSLKIFMHKFKIITINIRQQISSKYSNVEQKTTRLDSLLPHY